MADTAIAITAGTGTNVDTRTEATNGNHRQVIVIGDPSTNAGVAPVDATNGLAVDVKAAVITSGTITTVSTVSSVTAIAGALPAGNNNIGDVDVASVTGNVTVVQGTGTNLHMVVDSGTITTVSAVTAISNALPAGNNNIGDIDVASIAAGNNNIGDVDIATIAAGDNNIGNVDIVTMPNVTLAAGTNTNEVVGDAAHDAAVAGNPVLIGAEARDTLGTVVATGDAVRISANRYGMLLITSIPTSHASSNGTPITATTTSVIAAPSAGTHLRILRFHISNGGSTSTWVSIRDGAAGTQYYRTFLPLNGVVSLNLNQSGPLELTSATRLDIVLSAAGSVEYTIDYLTVTD